MNERQRNIVVGLTTLAGLAGLVFLLMLFGYVPTFLQDGYELRVELPRAGGLHSESRVRFSGIDIGSVREVRLQRAPEVGVVVTALIRKDVAIPVTAEATVASQLFGGGSSLEFVQSGPIPPNTDTLPTDGTAIVQGEIPDLLTTFSQEMQAAIEQPLEDFKRVADQFARISEEWTVVGRNINALLEARDVGAVDRGEAAGNLATVLARMDARMAELEAVIANINAYVGDEQLREDIRQTAANTRDLTGTVSENLGSLTEKYIAVADDLSATLGEMREAVAQARTGEGTVGKLLADPALYNNLNDAAQRLQKAIDELRLLAAKWKAEGLPVQF